MGAQLGPSDYLTPYVERLFAARHLELRAMTPEALLVAVGEELEVVCASEAEIEAVAAKLRAKLRDDMIPGELVRPADGKSDLLR